MVGGWGGGFGGLPPAVRAKRQNGSATHAHRPLLPSHLHGQTSEWPACPSPSELDWNPQAALKIPSPTSYHPAAHCPPSLPGPWPPKPQVQGSFYIMEIPPRVEAIPAPGEAIPLSPASHQDPAPPKIGQHWPLCCLSKTTANVAKPP